MLVRIMGLAFSIALLAVQTLAFGDDAPAWLRQGAALKVPAFDKKVATVVLVDESTVTVGEDGRVTRVSTYAIRILNREGRSAAVAREGYDTDSGKVREMHAWLIRPSGQVKSYGKDYTLDEAEALNDVYDESRLKKISAVDDAEPGSVFGFQATTEERPFFNQTVWYFQEKDPVVSSHLTLVLPAGWKANGITFNHEKVEPTINGTSYSWELRDLPPLEFEPASPSWHNLVPLLAVDYSPTEGTRAPATRSFDNWTEISRWYTGISDPQSAPDDRIAAKARELTTNTKTELERIQAIGRFVQSIQYISIQIGVGRWRPHTAAQVFAKFRDRIRPANLYQHLVHVHRLRLRWIARSLRAFCRLRLCFPRTRRALFFRRYQCVVPALRLGFK